MSIYPIVPTDFKTLKNACRKGLSIEGRIYWWPVMIPVKKDTIISEYPDVEGTAERLTNLVCEFFAGTSSNPTFDWKTDVLMRALEKRKTIERPELLVRLIRIIAECIPQIEVCFLIGCDLLAYPEKYVQTTALAHGSRLYTFTEVLRRYLPKTANILDEIGALQPHFLNLMFVDFFRTLLPRQSVLSLLDAYLLEGWRILLRYGLSLIKGYKAQIKARRFGTGEDFWHAVQASARSMSASIDTTKVESILQAIKINSFDVERPMLERLYRPMNISTTNLEKFMNEGKRSLQRQSPTDTSVFESKLSPRQPVIHPDSRSSMVGMMGSDINRDSVVTVSQTSDNEVYGHVSGEQSDEIRPIFEAICQKSDILHPDDTSRLLNMLPQAVIRDGLELAFSTTRCGWALGSLYAEVKDLRPCVLLLQTLPQERSRGRSASDAGKNFEKSDSEVSEPKVIGEDDDDDITNFASQEERGVILGVYLPCTMSPPSTSVRGDPEAFVFRLTDGLGASSSVPANKGFKFQSSMSTKKGGIIPPGSDGATLSQFAVCASSYMSFGASSKHSTNAIRIDEELRWVATGASDTFSSPPLLISSECDTNAMAGLTMIPARRGSFSSAALSPGIRPSRSRSQSQENIGAGSPQSSILGAASAPAPVDIDHRASIKHIEVWVGKSSFNSSSGNKTKQSILGR